MALSDADKARIRAEEEERARARAGIKKKNDAKAAKGCLFGFVLVVAIIAVIAIAVTLSSSNNPIKSTPTYSGPEIEYVVTGTAIAVDVTLNNATSGTEQYSNVRLPVTYSYTKFPDHFVYISAQNQGSSGSVTAQIFYKGSLVKTSTSSGAYVIASVSGSK